MSPKLKKTIIVLTGVLASSSAFSSPNTVQKSWEFSLSPYMWLTDHKGSGGSPALPPADISSKDLLSDAHFSASFVAAAQKGAHGIYADYSYSDLRSEEMIGPIIGNFNVNTKTTLFSLAYGFDVWENSNTNVKLLAGARYWDVDYQYKIDSITFSSEASDRWFDATLGVWAKHHFENSKFYLSGGANVGGLSSKYFYDVQTNLGYQWTSSIGTLLGYRYFDVDYNKNDFVYDVAQKGLHLGFSWSF
ncbi:hypothetical protein AB4455_05900 [Vibrio sp. 10N.261.46.E12]|uniref:hypothetical protein n=1 Tax=unclassified Vibrio TaxID=2614977 RepID=UPI000975E694|nr:MULTISPECIES: hypothetical protein [unclassified Vibrio]OMO35063.1 hypothetical protein BH584_10650 [Vibrio sp. 10N.261.45.E1]PMJ36244.1 hypothetical protein BCU27_23320 [Vibrio sp. 10N.286.45.B6]PML96133.1 hypothetical protein BCT66_22275 [Vibrio sp. 10N.261.49.E11]PMM68420.1 hypothetical protein BCT48_11685 [Vibrio sp. 10N.261.46.F12]PMM80280.1 hypothetical protein BCT46_18325 [Vibrio sp. 10N.261.46.E8]